MACLTAREIFPLCHYFATIKYLWENEYCHVGRNEMAGLKGKSGKNIPAPHLFIVGDIMETLMCKHFE